MNTPGDFKSGEDGRRGAGKKGRSGRPSQEFRALCRTLCDNPKVLDNVKKVLANPNHPRFVHLWQIVSEFGHGKALQTIEMNGALPEIKVTFE